MASIDLIRASNGSGDAVKATVANARVISSMTIQVDATTNWPSKFIATVGSVDGTGAFVPATVTVFNGILSGGNIEITSFAPGYTDLGNTPGQVVVLKPTTAWANEVANTLAVAHNDSGTLKNDSVTTAAITDANVTTAKIADSAVTSGKIDFATFPAQSVDAEGWTVYTYPKWTIYRKRLVLGASSITAADEDRQAYSKLPTGMSTLPPKSALSGTNTTQNFGAKLGITVTPENVGGENRIYVTFTNNSSTTRTFTDMSANVEIII